jgi:opacity protein-like surface antigen
LNKLILIAASAVLLAACASAPKPTQAVPPHKDVTLGEINAAIDDGKKIQNEKGEEMICRREPKIGSRLARETICMTRNEWTQLSEESQRATRKSMRNGRIPHGT